MTDQQKYLKISVVIDNGEKTSIQTFYRAREVTYGMENVDLDLTNNSRLYGISFKADFDKENDCVSTSEAFKNDDGELWVRKGGILRKLGL